MRGDSVGVYHVSCKRGRIFFLVRSRPSQVWRALPATAHIEVAKAVRISVVLECVRSSVSESGDGASGGL